MKFETAKIIEAGRRDFILDRRFPLGHPASARPERGLGDAAYYSKKHAPGGPGRGKYWPLHRTLRDWDEK